MFQSLAAPAFGPTLPSCGSQTAGLSRLSSLTWLNLYRRWLKAGTPPGTSNPVTETSLGTVALVLALVLFLAWDLYGSMGERDDPSGGTTTGSVPAQVVSLQPPQPGTSGEPQTAAP